MRTVRKKRTRSIPAPSRKSAVSDRTVTLNANTQNAGDHSVTTDMDMSIPRKAPAVVSSHRGDVSCSGRDGDVEISGQHGDVAAADINGKVTLNLAGGSARVSKFPADVSVQGRADDISLADIQRCRPPDGEFDTIKLAKIAGAVNFKSARTDMEFSRLDGDLDMDSGDMRATDLTGPFRLLTRSKDIRVAGVNGDVRLQNENGAIEIRMNKLGSMQVSNRNSDIQIFLPDKAAFQVDAHSRGGEIESDFNVLNVKNNNDQATASGTIGSGGPHLVISNEHGGIELRKGSSLAEAPTPPRPPHPPTPPKVPVPTEN